MNTPEQLRKRQEISEKLAKAYAAYKQSIEDIEVVSGVVTSREGPSVEAARVLGSRPWLGGATRGCQTGGGPRCARRYCDKCNDIASGRGSEGAGGEEAVESGWGQAGRDRGVG